MSKHFKLGALNKKTGQYIRPENASKEDEYQCPECKSDVIWKNGLIRIRHFSHKDSCNCKYYDKPSESEIHKNAKYIMKAFLESRIPITMVRKCLICNKIYHFSTPIVTDTSSIVLEHRFQFNGKTKVGDVNHIEGKNEMPVCIYEICHTHRTNDCDRPEPWYEVDSIVLHYIASIELENIKIPCIREFYCENCTEKGENSDYHDNKEIPHLSEQMMRVSNISEHIDYLVEYEKNHQTLDLDYDWLKKHIENIEYDYVVNQYLLCIPSWIMFLLEYSEKICNGRCNDMQYECIYHTFFDKEKIFCQGEAGTGKSFIIKVVSKISSLLGYRIYRMALTGLAAKNIEGQTISKFLKNDSNKLKKGDIIIIDEISTVNCDQMTNILSRIGNMQILYFGDFAQFPPIDKKNKDKFCVHSPKWKIDRYIELTENVRQSGDTEYAICLSKIRRGIIDKQVKKLIESRVNPKYFNEASQNVYDFCKDVNHHNLTKMEELKEDIHTFESEIIFYDKNYDTEEIRFEIEEKYNLKLCIGCEVFVNRNINKYLVNGLKATIIDINQDQITIKEDISEIVSIIERKIVKMKKNGEKDEDDDEDDIDETDNKKIYSVKQFPIELGFACTLYKMQGQTREDIIMNLTSSKYRDSSFYVGASRTKKKEGLFIMTDREINYEEIRPSKVQLKLINGFVHMCKGCEILMKENVHFCDNCRYVPEFSDVKFNVFKGMLIEDFFKVVSKDKHLFESFASEKEEIVWKNFLNGLKILRIFYSTNLISYDVKKCAECKKHMKKDDEYDICYDCYKNEYKNKYKKCTKCKKNMKKDSEYDICYDCYKNEYKNKYKKCTKCKKNMKKDSEYDTCYNCKQTTYKSTSKYKK